VAEWRALTHWRLQRDVRTPKECNQARGVSWGGTSEGIEKGCDRVRGSLPEDCKVLPLETRQVRTKENNKARGTHQRL